MNMGLHRDQTCDIINQTLRDISGDIPFSWVGFCLVKETLWHESGEFVYVKQWPVGPGRGLCQMEAPTLEWLNRSWMPKMQSFSKFMASWPKCTEEDLVADVRVAAAMCRLRYWVAPAPLPTEAEGLEARARYWGKWYQTSNDEKKIQQYIKHADKLYGRSGN